MYHGFYVEVRGQLLGKLALFPPCGPWGLNSGRHLYLLSHLPALRRSFFTSVKAQQEPTWAVGHKLFAYIQPMSEKDL